jgi:hypothetical protein
MKASLFFLTLPGSSSVLCKRGCIAVVFDKRMSNPAATAANTTVILYKTVSLRFLTVNRLRLPVSLVVALVDAEADAELEAAAVVPL